MNFQGLAKVEKYQFYLDTAFNRASKRTDIKKEGMKIKDRLSKSKQIESLRIQFVHDSLKAQLQKILDSFPEFDELPDFYKELVKVTMEYEELKRSLGAVNWAIKKVIFFYRAYNAKIHKAQQLNMINVHRRQFYGRISSILKQINKNLMFLEEARRIMKSYPNVKTSLRTIAIVGFPNVGKTTLLSKLTGSKPEINDYAFTTKGINIGYTKDKTQIIDTPGTLDRFNKMNNIEKQAYLVMKYCAEKLIYVFDLTGPYPIKDQLKLFNNLKELGKEIIVYFSKTDIIDKKEIDEFKIKGVSDIEKLKEILSKP